MQKFIFPELPGNHLNSDLEILKVRKLEIFNSFYQELSSLNFRVDSLYSEMLLPSFIFSIMIGSFWSDTVNVRFPAWTKLYCKDSLKDEDTSTNQIIKKMRRRTGCSYLFIIFVAFHSLTWRRIVEEDDNNDYQNTLVHLWSVTVQGRGIINVFDDPKGNDSRVLGF